MTKKRVFFCLLALMMAVLPVFGQNLSVNYKAKTIEQVIHDLESKTNYSFVYQKQELAKAPSVTLSLQNAPFEDILQSICSEAGLSYEIVKQSVILKKGQPKPQSSNAVTVSGIVTDQNGAPVVGASVYDRESRQGTSTDLDGKYSLSVKPGSTLVYSSIGYVEANRLAQAGKINVTLAEDATLLDDVVVIGYGAVTKKKDLSAAVGIVASPQELAKAPVTSTTSLLQGQIPGVVVSNREGGPNSSPSMVIRGQGSKNGDSVLWIVDGISGAPIPSVSDIESIVVLKDAASAAIYGAQSGAGGVILVTTKKGTKGVSVSYDGVYGVNKPCNLIQSLDAQQEIEVNKIAYQNAGQPLPEGWDVTKNPYVGTTRTDWMSEMFRNALFQRHNVAFSGGTDKMIHRLSLAMDKNEGTIIGTWNKNLKITYKGEYQVNKWLKFSENMYWSTSDWRSPNTQSGLIDAMSMPRSASLYQSIYNADGTYSYDTRSYGGTAIEDASYIAKYGDYSGIHGIVSNPVHAILGFNYKNLSQNLVSSSALEVANIVKGLKFVSRYTYSTGNGFSKQFTGMRLEVGDPSDKTTLAYSASKSSGWNTENTLTYDNTFGLHTVGAMFATTANRSWSMSFGVNENGFEDESEYLQYIQFGDLSTLYASDGYGGPDANVAFISRLAYSFDDRYFMTVSYRRDYAGRLPEGHNYGDFPAVTGGWKISSEPFFPKNDVVTFAKLRASWGRVGNLGSIPVNYKSNTMSSYPYDRHPNYDVTNATLVSGAQFYNGKALNLNLTWETSEQTDLGLDLAFFKDRLNFSVDGYYKRTYNLIQGQTINWPSTIGVSAMTINTGQISNRGVELSLGWADRAGDFSYYINANAAYNKNRVDDIGVKDADGKSSVWTSQDEERGMYHYWYTREGGELREFYLIKCLGIFQSEEDIYEHSKDGKLIQPYAQPGDLKFEDYDGDGKIGTGDRQYLGNCVPDWTFNLNLGATWKNLSVSTQLYGVYGAQTINTTKIFALSMSSKTHNRSTEILNAWTENNRNAVIPRINKVDNNGNFSTGSTFYLEDTSFLRLKNLTVSYDCSKLLSRMSHFAERNTNCSVYFSGENLGVLTRYSGMDPEVGEKDRFNYPMCRTLSMGIKLTY